MTVYVDDMHLTNMGRLGRMKMCHMTADSTEELLKMAYNLGMSRDWLQEEGTWKEHFDVATGKRAKAVALGAVEITMKQTVALAKARWAARLNPEKENHEQTV